jgi:hypothetical protein
MKSLEKKEISSADKESNTVLGPCARGLVTIPTTLSHLPYALRGPPILFMYWAQKCLKLALAVRISNFACLRVCKAELRGDCIGIIESNIRQRNIVRKTQSLLVACAFLTAV